MNIQGAIETKYSTNIVKTFFIIPANWAFAMLFQENHILFPAGDRKN